MTEGAGKDVVDWSEEMLQEALDRARAVPPLTNDEVKTLREVITEWRYQQRRKDERKRNWPVIALAASFLTTAAGWAVNFLASYYAKKGP
jgi:hypothetical protein